MMNMSSKLSSILICAFLSLLLTVFPATSARTTLADGTIYIRPNGTLDPPTAPILRIGDVYTLIGSIITATDGIIIQKDGITLDCAGHEIQGAGSGTAVDLTNRTSTIIKNVKTNNFDYGIKLFSSTNNTVINNTISTNNWNGIGLFYSSNNTITENSMTQCQYYGIGLDNSQNNTINENIMTNNNGGLYFDWSSDNLVAGNNVTANDGNGIRLQDAANNTLRNNTMANNMYNFEVFGNTPVYVGHDIDSSNTVNGKPIYYWINEADKTIPENAGFVGLVNCTKITVQNLTLTDNGRGILAAGTSNSTIANNNIANNLWGIWLYECTNNTITANYLASNGYYGIDSVYSSYNTIRANTIRTSYVVGLRLDNSDHNIIAENLVTENNRGIEAYGTSNDLRANRISANSENGMHFKSLSSSTITGNNITGNGCGIKLSSSSNNEIYNNNFMSNARDVDAQTVGNPNLWDGGYPLGGNYWGGGVYADLNKGVEQDEAGSDGMRDTPQAIATNNTDNYPLMGIFTSFSTPTSHSVTVVSNSTIESFEYSGFNATITLRVSSAGTNQTIGFCQVCIPHALMNVTSISVVIDDGFGQLLYHDYDLHDNGTHRWIYFSYEQPVQVIRIVPEFPMNQVMLALIAMATLIVTIIHGRNGALKQETWIRDRE